MPAGLTQRECAVLQRASLDSLEWSSRAPGASATHAAVPASGRVLSDRSGGAGRDLHGGQRIIVALRVVVHRRAGSEEERMGFSYVEGMSRRTRHTTHSWWRVRDCPT
jgi:hypothetical protein